MKFRSALEANPLDGPSHREITLALERLGEREKADAFASRGARLFQAHPDLQYKLGLFFFERRAFRRDGSTWAVDEAGLADAFACFRRASEGNPAYFERSLEIVERSMPGLEDLSPLVPPTPSARLRYARFLARRGRWAEAAKIEEDVIAEDGDGPDARIRAGEARLHEKRHEEGMLHFAAAFDGWRLNPRQVRRMCDAFLRSKQAPRGTEFFLSRKSLRPEEKIPVTLALGRLFLSLERFEDAPTMCSVPWPKGWATSSRRSGT
jgi:tetratricopeptide (TPR) repeat protein